MKVRELIRKLKQQHPEEEVMSLCDELGIYHDNFQFKRVEVALWGGSGEKAEWMKDDFDYTKIGYKKVSNPKTIITL